MDPISEQAHHDDEPFIREPEAGVSDRHTMELAELGGVEDESILHERCPVHPC